jgi:hypothetical protein
MLWCKGHTKIFYHIRIEYLFRLKGVWSVQGYLMNFRDVTEDEITDWHIEDEQRLLEMYRQGTSFKEMAVGFDKSETAIRRKLRELNCNPLGASTRPTRQKRQMMSAVVRE